MSKIDELKFDDKNFNKHTERGMGLLEKSLRDFGAGRSILIDKDNNIIAGNGIVEAAGQIGLDDVQIVETDGTKLIAVKRTDVALDSEAGRRMAFADNATASADLDWDKDNIGEFFSPEDTEEWGVSIDWANDEEIVEDEAPEVDESEPAKSVLGGVYQLGEHRLMCGDSTDAGSVAILMDGQKADLWVTDPPYNVNYGAQKAPTMKKLHHRTDGLTVANDNMESTQFLNFLANAYNTADGVMKDGAAFYIWHASAEVNNFTEALKKTNWQLRQIIIWVKDRIAMGLQDSQWQHEPCLYGWKNGAGHYFTMDRTNATIIDDRQDINKMTKGELVATVKELLKKGVKSTALDCEKPNRSEEHPTMKPVKLIAMLIRNSSQPGWRVLDSFGGSGTTLIACEQLGRKCYMMELDPKYCDVIRKRWWKFTQGTEEGWEEGTPEIGGNNGE